MNAELVAALVDLGGQGLLVFFIIQLWLEQKANNQYLRDQAKAQMEADEQRREMKEELESLQAYRAAAEARRKASGPNVN